MRALDRRSVARLVAVAVPSLALATVAVAILQDGLGVPNPSAVYLVAVVATAIVSGTGGAILTAVAAFLLYNFLFTEPRYTLAMHEPGVWLSVVLLLFVGVVVGQLAALQRSRTEVARQREREARALFSVSRRLVTRGSVESVLGEIASALQSEAHMERAWITTGDAPPAASDHGVVIQLRRMAGDAPPQWVRVHQPTSRSRGPTDDELYRVVIESSGTTLGSIWGLRARSAGPPDADETRLLAATADQLGQAIAHDRMAADAQAAAIARESDALKSALLQSVSHDLRTPLATIRAGAGSLRSGNDLKPHEQDETVVAIEREVDYLNRLVTNMLDLSRIEAGVLHADLDVFELDDLVGATLDRLRGRLGGRTLLVDLEAPAVQADPTFMDSVVTNLVENAIKYTPADATIRISAHRAPDDRVILTVEDSGPGVPDDALSRLFEKFYRVPGSRTTSRAGTGVGLAVVRGLVEAMGDSVSARRSELGGLAIDIVLRAAPDEAPSTAASGADGNA